MINQKATRTLVLFFKCCLFHFKSLLINEKVQQDFISHCTLMFYYLVRQTESLYSICNYITIINVPIPIKTHPINDFIVKSSCKKTNANIKVITTLNLSIGTTFDASPICNAL